MVADVVDGTALTPSLWGRGCAVPRHTHNYSGTALPNSLHSRFSSVTSAFFVITV